MYVLLPFVCFITFEICIMLAISGMGVVERLVLMVWQCWGGEVEAPANTAQSTTGRRRGI